MSGYETRDIVRISKDKTKRDSDFIVEEGALSIKANSMKHGSHNLGVTMRTSGDDENLVIGLLYSEGIIQNLDDIESLNSHGNSIDVSLNDSSSFDPLIHCRASTVTSACGICGRSTIDDILHMHVPELGDGCNISIELISRCLETMRSKQALFSKTGGSHACASFNQHGEIGMIFEDVGRHNAMDKLVGHHLKLGNLPMTNMISIVSGRASFELVQKSIRAGFPIMAAIGAPSTMAIDLAREYGKTLVCFAKTKSATIYSGFRRISTI